MWPVEVCRMPRPSVSAPPEGAGAYAELTGAGTGVGLWHSWGKCPSRASGAEGPPGRVGATLTKQRLRP